VQLQDIIFILLRHKWKILTCSALGLAAAAALFLVVKPDYQSTAKLLVRYVMDSGGVDAMGADRRIQTPDARGENIINSEIEILTSWDLGLAVADVIGPAKIVPPKVPGETNRNAAAAQIIKNLEVGVPKRSSVIVVTYRHPDPEMARKVLAEVVERYLERHLEVHRGIGSFDLLTRQTDQLRSELNASETQLQELKHKAGVVTLLEGRQRVAADINRLEQSILDSEADLAGRQAHLAETEKSPRGMASPPMSASTNAVEQVDPAVLEEYRALAEKLSFLKSNLSALLIHYKDGHPEVQLLQRQTAETEALRKSLEVKHPDLLSTPLGMTATTSATGRELALDPRTERAQLAGLEARLKILKAGLEKCRQEAATIDAEESQITQIERKKEQLVTNYRYFSESLEKARVDAQVDPTKMPNISKVQEPSLPVRVASKLLKVVAALALGGLAFGVAWALLLDLVIDQKIRRPIEIESRLRIPLLLSIPFVAQEGLARLLQAPEANQPPSEMLAVTGPVPERSPWELIQFVRPFCEALRDRVTLYFHLKNVTRRPKLIALTGCGDGAGVTTLAAGLAAALSEIGDGKVLLVDANSSSAEGHPFFRGGAVPDLAAALQPGRAGPPAFGNNFCLATATKVGDKTLPMVPRIYDLVPKLRSCDYDYIIFDLPPMTQTSAALTLAGLMDQVLLVAEAEKTNRDTLKWAFNSLRQAEANVLGVFNKGRNQTPSWLRRGT
jgi:uncharacterized protein involved in exopolysaccharide biosynthesis/Mrp family chromosome partitioning ATPase